jgi:eukaryotic translation initiation factor 2-alpha kinase 4
MVDRVVEGVREILEDAAIAMANGVNLPSLEEERAAHEAALAKAAQEQKQEEELKRLEESKEEQRVLGGLVEEEIKRQREKAKEWRKNKQNRPDTFIPVQPLVNMPKGQSDCITFETPCRTTDKSGNAVFFSAVSGKSEHRTGLVSTVYIVRAMVADNHDCPNLALKEAVLRLGNKEPGQFKKQIQGLEAQLESLKKLHHRHLLEIMDFRVDREAATGEVTTPNVWTVSILTPFAEKGALEELLDLSGHLDISKIRTWTTDLLDGLNYLHSNSLVHQNIHPGNILLFRERAGDIVPKLSDACYQRELRNMCVKSQVLPALSSAKSAYWLPPEIAAASKPQYTQKTDIWDFGVVVLQMIFGLDSPQKYHSPAALMEAHSLSKPLLELVTKFFKPEPKKRPRAFELSSSEFLATDAPVLSDDSTGMMASYQSLSSMPQVAPNRMRRESFPAGVPMSRYQQDFVEEGRLGKGGFGEVVKARQKLDGQIYAIKKITQRSQASLTEVIKEVRLLSRISHPAVVRYYGTWIEEIPDLSDTEGETSTEDMTTEDSKETISQEPDIQFATSTGGLDFMSSSGYPQVEFGYDDSEGEDEEDDDGDDSDEESSDVEDRQMGGKSLMKDERANGPKRIRFQRPYKTVLYISMEYCEKRVCFTRQQDKRRHPTNVTFHMEMGINPRCYIGSC